MQVHKEILLFCGLLILSISLLVASGVEKPISQPSPCTQPVKCCQQSPKPVKPVMPWNYITDGLLHISA